MISPAALNFLAGLFAGAAINMLTTVSTDPAPDVSTRQVVLDSGMWVLAAGFLTWSAQILQRAERDADLYIDRDFSHSERKEIRDEYLRLAFRHARLPLVLTAAALLAAILLLPRFLM